MRVGDAVRLAARPDEFTLVGKVKGSTPATVTTAELHGHAFMCGGTGQEGDELWFRAPRKPTLGEKVNLAFEPSKTRLFAAESKRAQ